MYAAGWQVRGGGRCCWICAKDSRCCRIRIIGVAMGTNAPARQRSSIVGLFSVRVKVNNSIPFSGTGEAMCQLIESAPGEPRLCYAVALLATAIFIRDSRNEEGCQQRKLQLPGSCAAPLTHTVNYLFPNGLSQLYSPKFHTELIIQPEGLATAMSLSFAQQTHCLWYIRR